MAYPSSFIRSQASWSLAQGESASCSVSWSQTGGFFDLGVADHDAIVLKWLAFWGEIRGDFPDDTVMSGVKTMLINTSGNTIQTRETGLSSAGTSTAANMPSEVSVCVSLLTESASRGGRGRFYLPNPTTAALATTGRLDGTVQDNIADAAQVLLGADTATGLFSIVASAADVQLRPVLNVRVGDVFDVQRRRRDDLTEIYENRAVDSTP